MNISGLFIVQKKYKNLVKVGELSTPAKMKTPDSQTPTMKKIWLKVEMRLNILSDKISLANIVSL